MEPNQIVLRSLRDLAGDFLSLLPQLAIGLAFLAVTWLAAAGADRGLKNVFGRTRIRKSLGELFRQLATILIWVAGLLTAAVIIFPTVTPAKALTALGLGSIAVGFAFKDIFENFIAGMLILLREPFQLGDCIECQGLEGFVEEITIRDTHIRQTDGQRVVIPNAALFMNPVTVRTDLDLRRTTIVCGVAYGEDVDRSREVIRSAVEGLPTVSTRKDVEIFAQGFGASSIDFEVTWWTGSRPLDIRRSRDEVVAAVKRALDDAGIEIPFPYRTLTFKDPVGVSVRHGDGAFREDD
ncbi:mechanosensitive ion channel family protein [Tautonia plasticadhaerens]|uniref:Small-conductance mechanosensitive channel n=1 Tax=Tautonia plasticadhaerens TaxID=2527974 RepID=A0A518HCQ5_9BACT|nr:mechanosensitive ion channel family protein [Tautonia plasticadhaerens]QDV38645.1 Small-conductance mechanosensitive channel [Tautonia plasticadhaerens]